MLLWALTPRLSEWIHESLHVRIQENILQCKIYIHQVSNVNFGNLRFLYPSLRHVTATSVTSTRLFNTSLRDKFVTPTRHFETNSSLRHVTSTLCHFDKSLRQKSYILASSTVFFSQTDNDVWNGRKFDRCHFWGAAHQQTMHKKRTRKENLSSS